MSALTIYECPACAYVSTIGRVCYGSCDAGFHEQVYMCEIRVFREEDVRPLWEELRDARRIPSTIAALPGVGHALDAFPAPDDWTAER